MFIDGPGIVRPSTANAGLVNRPILDVAASPSFASDGTLVLATLQDGVLVSRDGGLTWMSTLDDPSLGPVTAVRLSPDFAQDGIAGGIAGGQVIWSADSGRSWVRIGGLTDDAAASLLEFSPDFAADGQVAIGRLDGLLYLSHDRGQTWRSVWTGIDCSDVLALAYSPHFGEDRSMVAALGDAHRLVAIRSSDAGETWMALGRIRRRPGLGLAGRSAYIQTRSRTCAFWPPATES